MTTESHRKVLDAGCVLWSSLPRLDNRVSLEYRDPLLMQRIFEARDLDGGVCRFYVERDFLITR
jgi:hypothetical protein